MEADIDIRPATEGDVDEMSQLLAELFRTERDFTAEHKKQRLALLLLILQRDRACIYVAEEKQRIIAMCSAQIVISTAEGAPSAWIEDLIVCRDHRGKGIARMLLSRIEVWCREHDITRIQLLADMQNQAALDYYHRQNWQQTQLVAWRKVLSES